MELFASNSGKLIIISFASAILLGALLLTLPFSAAGESVSFIDALFTSTSAICVTGLTVVDTGKDFSLPGQIIILILIQLGGLGIMTFTTGLFLSLGTRISFAERLGLSQSLGGEGRVMTHSLIKSVIFITLTIELAGAALLFLRFRERLPVGEAIFASVFHSIAAFCNAGFSTFSDNLRGFNNDVSIILIIGFLIIFGGLGFILIRELLAKFKRKKSRLSLHAKIGLTGTAILLISATIIFYLLEYNKAYSSLDGASAIANAFFQSVTPRTAGFDTILQSNLTEISLIFTMILMFIGVCPGSTGGGIKITSMSIIILLVYSRFVGKNSVSAFKRSLATESIIQAVTIFMLAILAISVATVALMLLGGGYNSHDSDPGWLIKCLFEVISAFGTVGLSLGITPGLSVGGKLVLIVCMFCGRVGLLTLAYGLARVPVHGEIVYSEEQIMIG
jgi:trk system potassium uptake protein TrkH